MKERLYETGSKEPVSTPSTKEELVFTAPVDGIYKFNKDGIKLVKRLQKGQSIDLKKFKNANANDDTNAV